MKNILQFLACLVLFTSCNDKLDLEGEFVKVIKSDLENNVYTFDFNNKIKISDNGQNYLVTDANGNKSIATFEKGLISYNNCNIVIDKTENVLTNTCTNNNKSYSDDYWPLEKVNKYLSNIGDIKYDNYINPYLQAISDGYDAVPTKADLNDKDKEHLDKNIETSNPFYPFMVFGDFNNDNKYPDIAVFGTNQEGMDIYDKYYTSLHFLHAGSERLKNYNFEKLYPFMEALNGSQMGFDDKQQDIVRIYNIKDWSGWDITWKNGRYINEYVNLH